MLYDVMNDYDGTIDSTTPKCPSFLNGDTAVTSSLTMRKQKFKAPTLFLGGPSDNHEEMAFDIMEDMNVSEEVPVLEPLPAEMNKLLYMPLPLSPHLPGVRKDLLIIVPAYHGDIDRYSRLRRPVMLQWEPYYIVRGIYHSTPFARWWSLQDLSGVNGICKDRIAQAIHARFIMNNDLTRIKTGTYQKHLPKSICYSCLAHESIYKELFRRQPRHMKEPVARACMIGDFQDLYDTLDVEPTEGLMIEAHAAPNKHYLIDLERKIAEAAVLQRAYQYEVTYRGLMESRSELLYSSLNEDCMGASEFYPWYNTSAPSMSDIELFISVSDKEKQKIRFDGYGRAEMVEGFGFAPVQHPRP